MAGGGGCGQECVEANWTNYWVYWVFLERQTAEQGCHGSGGVDFQGNSARIVDIGAPPRAFALPNPANSTGMLECRLSMLSPSSYRRSLGPQPKNS